MNPENNGAAVAFFFVSGELENVAFLLYNTVGLSAKNMGCWCKRKSGVFSFILDAVLIKFCHEKKGWAAHRGGTYCSQWETVEQTVNCVCCLCRQNRTLEGCFCSVLFMDARTSQKRQFPSAGNQCIFLNNLQKKLTWPQEQVRTMLWWSCIPTAMVLCPSPAASAYLPCQNLNVAIAKRKDLQPHRGKPWSMLQSSNNPICFYWLLLARSSL